MARVYLKKSTKTASTGSDDVRATVMGILNDIETGGDAAALDYAAKFDGYDGNLILTEAEIQSACDLVPEKLKQDIQFAHANVKRFAEAQRGTITDFETEIVPGSMRPSPQGINAILIIMAPIKKGLDISN